MCLEVEGVCTVSLQVLCACLSAIQSLGPDLTDLLCGPGIDVGAWTLFFHPSFRPVSAHDPSAQPSLASLTAVLELYDSHASKVICVLLGTRPPILLLLESLDTPPQSRIFMYF